MNLNNQIGRNKIMIHENDNQMYELLIYIPTYNRERKLENCLKIIEREIKGFEDKVCIYVSNNGSSDGTEKLLDSYKSDWLIYRSHDENKGAFLNIIAAYDLPIKAKFVWIIGDDDYLLPNAISDLLEKIIENPEIDFIFCNTTAFPAADHDSIMKNYLESGIIGIGNIKSNIYKNLEKVDFEKLIDPKIADTLLGELMVLCFRQEKFCFPYQKAVELNNKLQPTIGKDSCTLNEFGIISQPHNIGLMENLQSTTKALYNPLPKTFNFWGSAGEWLGNYDYVFPVIILFLIKQYRERKIINNEKYLYLIDYYFKIMQGSFQRQLTGTSPANKFTDKLKAEFFDAIFELGLAKGLFK